MPYCAHPRGQPHPAAWHVDAGTTTGTHWTGAACNLHLDQVLATAQRVTSPVTVHPAPGNTRTTPDREHDQQTALF